MADPRAPAPLPSAVTTFLAADERVERCPADRAYATRVVEGVVQEECEDTLHAAAQGRWTKANTHSYDGARKSVEAWLLSQGWRVRGAAGAHAAVVEVVRLWLEDTENPGPRITRTFAASRKARHDDEYPSPSAPDRTSRELRALVLDNTRLINLVRAALDMEERPEIVPTEEHLATRPER
jgi:hypothetical protein